MPDTDSALEQVAAARASDRLAPVTFIAPSHAAALQLRRRLAERTPFAAVRFETLPRLAELIAGGRLAAAGRVPLARPIGDYLAQEVARTAAGPPAAVAELPGFARVLRSIFRRLRRGGVTHSSQIAARAHAGHLNEILRLYDDFRQSAAAFYDPEDLLDEAARLVSSGAAPLLPELGDVYVMPPGALSAGAARLLEALRGRARSYRDLDDCPAAPGMRFVLAPDPSTEAREVAREVLSALESGAGLHETAVFFGAGSGYGRLLREAFAAAGIPAAALPGIPLIETRAGRGALLLATLPQKDFSRTYFIELLTTAPLKEWLPARDGRVAARAGAWDRVSRAAGVTHGDEVWARRLTAMSRDLEAQLAEEQRKGQEDRQRAIEFQRAAASELIAVAEALIARLRPLLERQPAAAFIATFKAIIDDYFDPGAEALEEVKREIDQLATVGAAGGSFNLESFALAFRANLETGAWRERPLGDGVLLADYRDAAGLRFKRVVLCGAYEGGLPAGPGSDTVLDDRTWSQLRDQFPFIEDGRARVERGRRETAQAVAAARDGLLVWSCPVYEPGGTREYYPSPEMVQAAARVNAAITTASALRGHPAAADWLRKPPSPLAAMLRGPVGDRLELCLRAAVRDKQSGREPGPGHPRYRAIQMLRARRGRRFTEWDGNLSSLSDSNWLELQRAVSPTSLENYAVCGYRYFCRSLLRLNVVEEPEEREMMEAAARGELVHRVLDRFFREAQANGRPQPGEEWTDDDRLRLGQLLDEALEEARGRGQTGLEVYHAHEARTIRADLMRFLEEDYRFRLETGATPSEFEVEVPPVQVAGVTLRGRADRVDRTPDGKRAWVIDYKTGSAADYEAMKNGDLLLRGARLQLPAYLEAVRDAEEAYALYWFISAKGEFQRIGYPASPENRERFARTVEAIVGGIRAGSFPAVSGEENDFYGNFDNCRHCDFDRICSRRRDIELGAKFDDAAILPWRGVAAATSADGEARDG
jgi:RecB family exonuclease